MSATFSKTKRMSNISLPEKPSPTEVPALSRRNTLTEEPVKTKKKGKPPSTPTIPEEEPKFAVDNERKPPSRKASTASRMSSKVAYDNKGFEGSLRSTSRAPSVQSLEVYREQYCCCARRTRCERSLLVTVSVLVIVIIVLIIVIAVLAKSNKLQTLFGV